MDKDGLGDDLDVIFAVSSDRGATWSAPSALNINAYSDTGHDTEPKLATNGLGTWLALWSSNEVRDGVALDYDLFLSTSDDNGASWTDPSPLRADYNADLYDDCNPAIAVNAIGTWMAVWSEDNMRILASRSIDLGQTWSTPIQLGGLINAQYPSLAGDGDGTNQSTK